METFIAQNLWLIVLFAIWSLYWKGRALWMAALARRKWWFIALLIINTLGILEILYIYWIRKWKTSN